jgi:hypothetical protein
MAKIALKLVRFENAKSLFSSIKLTSLARVLTQRKHRFGVKFAEHSSLPCKRVIGSDISIKSLKRKT